MGVASEITLKWILGMREKDIPPEWPENVVRNEACRVSDDIFWPRGFIHQTSNVRLTTSIAFDFVVRQVNVHADEHVDEADLLRYDSNTNDALEGLLYDTQFTPETNTTRQVPDDITTTTVEIDSRSSENDVFHALDTDLGLHKSQDNDSINVIAHIIDGINEENADNKQAVNASQESKREVNVDNHVNNDVHNTKDDLSTVFEVLEIVTGDNGLTSKHDDDIVNDDLVDNVQEDAVTVEKSEQRELFNRVFKSIHDEDTEALDKTNIGVNNPKTNDDPASSKKETKHDHVEYSENEVAGDAFEKSNDLVDYGNELVEFGNDTTTKDPVVFVNETLMHRSIDEHHLKETVSTKSNIILNGYMRSGSSFIGELLGHRADTIYYFEPLQKGSAWTFWNGSNQICHVTTLMCSPSSSASLDGALSNLNGIFQCLEGGLTHAVTSMSMHQGGPGIKKVKDCMRSKGDHAPHSCLDKLVSSCRRARYRVAKVLRMSLDGVAKLLDRDPKLKIIQLFRDPRAIINSRIKTVWYRLESTPSVLREHAQNVCMRMAYDIKTARHLAASHPTRFRMIQFETLMSDLQVRLKDVFEFLNIDFTKADQEKVNFITGVSDKEYVQDSVRHSRIEYVDRVKDYSFWWRTSMPWDRVAAIDSVCGEVYALLGYRRYKGEVELRNMNISGFV